MRGELIYYCFNCQDCLYSVGAFYPQFPIFKIKEHKRQYNHKVSKIIIEPKGICITV